MLILELQDISLAFGGLQALDQVSFAVAPGTVQAVIGPNGAGKTTLFNLITGFLSPQAGKVIFQGQEIQGEPPHEVARLGIARTFQLVQLFDHMTVLENVMVGRHRLSRAGLLAGALRLPWTKGEEKSIRERSYEELNFVGLADRANQPAATLPLGLKRLLEIARALAAEPALLLLDEPASGLDAVESERLQEMIQALRERGLTILLVEHDMGLTMEIADQIAVLNYGQLIATGTPREVQRNAEVISAYLGTDWQT